MSQRRRTPQTNADACIAQLSPEDQGELHDKCREYANASDLHRWLHDRFPELSYRSVLAWYKREYPPGERATHLNLKLAEYRGINPTDAHIASLAAVVELTDELMGRLRSNGLEQLSASHLSNLVDLLREQRQSAQALASQQKVSDRRSLELAGGYRVAEIMAKLAEGNPAVNGVVTELIRGAIVQLEDEVN